MDVSQFRQGEGLSQEGLATALGLRPASKGYISRLEAGHQKWPVTLALRMERLSNGKVPAATLCPEAAELLAGQAAAPAAASPQAGG